MRMLGSSLILTLGMLIAQTAIAQQCCEQGREECCGASRHCALCGRSAQCERMCQVVCEMRPETKTVWTVRCEEFCTLMPGCGGEKGCGGENGCVENGCVETNCAGGPGCAGEHCHLGECTPPRCGKAHSRLILVKKEVTVLKPHYECVPCYACQACAPSCVPEGAAPDPTKAIPAPSAPNAPRMAPPAPPAPRKTANAAPLPPQLIASGSEEN